MLHSRVVMSCASFRPFGNIPPCTRRRFPNLVAAYKRNFLSQSLLNWSRDCLYASLYQSYLLGVFVFGVLHVTWLETSSTLPPRWFVDVAEKTRVVTEKTRVAAEKTRVCTYLEIWSLSATWRWYGAKHLRLISGWMANINTARRVQGKPVVRKQSANFLDSSQ